MSDPMPQPLIITGANGYLGTSLKKYFRSLGHEILEPKGEEKTTWRMPAPLDSGSLQKAAILIHAAWDMKLEDPEQINLINVDGSKKLIDQSKALMVPFIFISS